MIWPIHTYVVRIGHRSCDRWKIYKTEQTEAGARQGKTQTWNQLNILIRDVSFLLVLRVRDWYICIAIHMCWRVACVCMCARCFNFYIQCVGAIERVCKCAYVFSALDFMLDRCNCQIGKWYSNLRLIVSVISVCSFRVHLIRFHFSVASTWSQSKVMQ